VPALFSQRRPLVPALFSQHRPLVRALRSARSPRFPSAHIWQAVEEGDEDDIRAFHYLWALQLNEESDAKEKWQVTELAIRGVLQTY
jgi:hypothetical protein